MGGCYLRDHFRRFPEIRAPPHVRLGQEVLNHPHADAVPHLLQLSVHLDVVAVVILAQLRHDRPVRQRHQLCVDLVNLRPEKGDMSCQLRLSRLAGRRK